jgi:hypothetical protein
VGTATYTTPPATGAPLIPATPPTTDPLTNPLTQPTAPVRATDLSEARPPIGPA